MREQTNQVADLMRIDSDLHAPPVLVVGMASLQFRCVLTPGEPAVHRLPAATACRCGRGLNCTFLECFDPTQEALAANLQTSDYSKVHVVSGDKTLSAIAALLYDDPQLWRPIAVANGIADPRSIRAGRRAARPVAAVHRPDDRGGARLAMARFAQYAPDFTVRVDGEPLPTAMRASITSVRYQDGLEGADRVELTLANAGPAVARPSAAAARQRVRAASSATRPTRSSGSSSARSPASTPSFPSGGMPTLTVVAHDFLQRLTIGTKDRAFALSLPCIGKFPLPDPLIAELVGCTNLLVPTVDPVGAALSFLTLLITYAIDPLEAKKSIRIQQGQSDFDFLSGLGQGERLGDVHRPHPGAAGYRLRFLFLTQDSALDVRSDVGQSLIEFTPRLTTVGQVAGIATRIWVAAIKTEFVIVLELGLRPRRVRPADLSRSRRPRRAARLGQGPGVLRDRRRRPGDRAAKLLGRAACRGSTTG